jgi:hypothetical protein
MLFHTYFITSFSQNATPTFIIEFILAIPIDIAYDT